MAHMKREYSQQRRQISIILYAMKNHSFARFAAAFILAACAAHSVMAAPQKGATEKAPVKKAAEKTAPVKKGVLLQGSGPMNINVRLSGRDANLLAGSYQSFLIDKYKRNVSEGVIAQENGMTAVVAITQGEIISAKPNDVAQSLTLAFSSKGGFWPGQTIPVSLATYHKVMPQSLSFMSFSQTEIKKVKRKFGREETKTRGSSWVATRGTVVIQKVTPTLVTFALKSVVFEVMKGQDPLVNVAKGSIVMNGIGGVTLTEIPDGFR